MKRREMLATTGAAVLGLSTFPFGWAGAAERKQKVLYFTRSVGFEHGAVHRDGDKLSRSEQVLTEMGRQHGVEVVCSKDGRVFDGDLEQYDAFLLYTCGDLTKSPSKQNTPPMSPEGKQKLLEMVAAGKGCVGFHSASDTFHSKGPRNENQAELDPYIAMLGGEFIVHGAQQKAKLRVTSPTFPGLENVGDSLELNEEWYALKNFADDLHVILVQETEGMRGGCYQRPPFPATWARMHGKGRVFFTSLGHRDDVWTNPLVQGIIEGGCGWALRRVDAGITPNIDKVAPKARQLTR